VGRAGPGRGHLGEQVGNFTPEVLILLEAHPFGLYDRHRLIEQSSRRRLGVRCHVIHHLPRMLRPGPAGH
jgi:hypothetical protein